MQVIGGDLAQGDQRARRSKGATHHAQRGHRSQAAGHGRHQGEQRRMDSAPPASQPAHSAGQLDIVSADQVRRLLYGRGLRSNHRRFDVV